MNDGHKSALAALAFVIAGCWFIATPDMPDVVPVMHIVGGIMMFLIAAGCVLVAVEEI